MLTEFRTCWEQYTPLKLHFAGGIMIIFFTKTGRTRLEETSDKKPLRGLAEWIKFHWPYKVNDSLLM